MSDCFKAIPESLVDPDPIFFDSVCLSLNAYRAPRVSMKGFQLEPGHQADCAPCHHVEVATVLPDNPADAFCSIVSCACVTSDHTEVGFKTSQARMHSACSGLKMFCA